MSAEMQQNSNEIASERYAIAASRQSAGNDIIETLTEQKKKQNDGTMVTVICITYNHEQFIAQALDSFLMQKTNFKFKIFVGEDCGPDGTADIIRKYAARYPDIIVPFLREKNMGAQRNLIDMCQKATSPYIAFCEGDDYWIDEYKLQKQYDYMESHLETRVCCTQTLVDAPEDWHLRSWYKAMPDGSIIFPNSTPGFKLMESYTPQYIYNLNVGHTSTMFFRWNYDLTIPNWYYEGIVGDVPLLLLQTNTKSIGFIAETTSVYRINSNGAWFSKDADSHFLRTRCEYIRYLTGMKNYAQMHFKNYPIITIENRIKLETANYLSVLVKNSDYDSIAKFFNDYPEAGALSLNAYLTFYKDSKTITSCYGWEGYKVAVRNPKFRKMIRPQVRIATKVLEFHRQFKIKYINFVSFLNYWFFSIIPKNKNLWAFSAFKMRGYMDNVKYLYEYTIEHHPEINAVWLTLDKNVYNQLCKEGKPTLMLNSKEGRKFLSHAEIAVIDHYRMTDLKPKYGLNHRTKIVQLWHGVGLKRMKDVINNSTFHGLQFSNDILINETDNSFQRIKKRIKYIRHAYFRELFEEYFMLLCPGQEHIDQVAKVLNIPIDRCFMCGHPRDINLHKSIITNDSPIKVLYSPTFRFNVYSERRMIDNLVNAGEIIQEHMEKLNATLTVRMHPHTWRSYNTQLIELSQRFDRILIDYEKDIYRTLGEYSVMITDYSSIAYDFVLCNRPIVFLVDDLSELFSSGEKLAYDYNEYSPGTKAKTWEDAIAAVDEYIADPHKDSDWRCRVRDEFYDMSVNNENNSKRIVEEIKRRIKYGDDLNEN